MQDSMTMAEVGSIVNVSGNRIATPFGPPSPGSTPTKMPSTSPTIIKARIFQVISTAKPCSSRPKASILIVALVAERRFQRAFRHDDVERDIERDEHDRGEQQRGHERLPQRDLADHAHEAGDQQETRDIEPEKLGGETKQRRRHEHR